MDSAATGNALQIYLSYRCKDAKGIEARSDLESLCEQRGYKLVYDKNGTRQGDSLTGFMEDLVSMPFVFLFLTPDYFRSAWCLFELIRLHELGKLEEYAEIVPLRLSADMDLKQKQPILDFWDSDREDARKERAFLAERLALPEAGDDSRTKQAIRELIEEAWEQTIAPELDSKQPTLDGADQNAILNDRLNHLLPSFEEAVEEEHRHFRIALRKALEAELRPPRLVDELKAELGVDADNKLPESLLNTGEAADAVATVTRVVKALRKWPGVSRDLWRQCYLQADKLCSLLLLDSIDPNWWFQNRRRILRENGERLSHTWVLEEKAFSEVVVSRSLTDARRVTRPCYDYDNRKKCVTPTREYNDPLLFDASPAATSEGLLATLFQDLMGRRPEGKETEHDELVNAIARRARSQYKVRRAPIHYLVGKSFMEDLRNADWYSQAREQWKGYLLFVVCDNDPPPGHHSPTREKQDQLLDQLAVFKELEFEEHDHANAG